jgi:hypothetical protein
MGRNLSRSRQGLQRKNDKGDESERPLLTFLPGNREINVGHPLALA